MKSTPQSSRLSAASAALLVAVLAASSVSFAQTSIWDGGSASSNSWGSLDNWNPNVAPTFNSSRDLVFNVLTRPGNDLGGSRIVRSLSYGADMDGAFLTNFRTFNGGAASTLTLQAASGNASITVDADATGDLNLGWSGTGTAGGSLILASNLDIDHNGTGTLTFSRQITGTGFGFTKSGSGTMVVSNFNTNSFTGVANFDAGRAIFGNTSSSTGDLNTASAVNLGGGTLEIRTTSALSKTLAPNTTVSANSTLAYNNLDSGDRTFTLSTGSLLLNADLTLQNMSNVGTNNNIVNVTRNITGSGALIVDTTNNVASGAVDFSKGRVQLSGDNTAWTGNLVVANGTAQFSGNNSFVPAAGSITLGTADSAFGAAIGFNQASTDVVVANALTVTTGGVRLIRNNGGPGSTNDITLDGTVTLNGNLTLDHANLGATESIIVNGAMTGSGGLDVSFVGPNPLAGSAVRLNGAKAYTGATTIGTGASLFLGSSSSLASSSINVGSGATFDVSASPFTLVSGRSIAGTGTVDGGFTFAAGSKLIFNTSAALNMTGSVSFGGFGVSDVTGLNSSTIAATYTLLNGTGSNINFTNVANVGFGQMVSLGGGMGAYFDTTGGDLSVVVSAIPEPSSFAVVSGFAAMGLIGLRRRRRSAE